MLKLLFVALPALVRAQAPADPAAGQEAASGAPTAGQEAPPAGSDPAPAEAGAPGGSTPADPPAGPPGGGPPGGTGQPFTVQFADRDGKFDATSPPNMGVSPDGKNWFSVTLQDDGQRPDVAAGDGLYATVMASYANGKTHVRLRRGDKTVWTDAFDFDQSLQFVELSLILSGGEVATQVVSRGGNANSNAGGGTAQGAGAAGASGGLPGAPVPGVPEEPRPVQVGPAPEADALSAGEARRVGGVRVVLAAVGGALFGGLVAWFAPRLRRSRKVLEPVWAPGEPTVAGRRLLAARGEVWSVPDANWLVPVLTALSKAAAAERPVLLVPGPSRRRELAAALTGVPHVSWLAVDQPAPDKVLEAWSALAALSTPLLVVDGVGALERPEDDEEKDAVLRELLGDHTGHSVVVVVAGDPASVDLVLEPAEQGLAGGGALRIRRAPDGQITLA